MGTMTHELEQAAADLNARSWAEVRAGIPVWHPRNDGEAAEGTPAGVIEDDGEGIQEEHPHADGDGEGGGEGAEGAAEQPNAVLDALRTFEQSITGRLDRIEGGGGQQEQGGARQEGGQQEEGALSDDELEALIDAVPFNDTNFDGDGYLTSTGQMVLMRLIAREAAGEAVSPIQQGRDEERREAEAADLEEKYPDLAGQGRDGEKFVEQMVQATIDRARRAGKPELALEPSYLEETYLIHMAQKAAASETPAGQQGSQVVLERGGSAAPARQRKADDEGSRIVALAKKSHFRLGDK